MTLLRPYSNWKGKPSAHEGAKQLPVSLDDGAERDGLSRVLHDERLEDGDFLGQHSNVVLAPAAHPRLLQAGQRHSRERHPIKIGGCRFIHKGERGAAPTASQQEAHC